MSLRTDLNNRELLKKCWKKIYWSKSVSKKSRSRGIDGQTIQAFYDDEKKNLDNIFLALKNNTYKLSPLFGFPVKKENKKQFRLITAAIVKDRIVHKAMLCVFNPKLFEYINTGVSYCGVKRNILSIKENDNVLNTKKAVLKLIEHIENKKYYFFKSDIKGFYDNVPKEKLYVLIKRLNADLLHDESLDQLIHDIIFFELGNKEELKKEKKAPIPNKYLGISQGSALSQFFANIYLADFDNEMKSIYGDRFVRYIDDFIIACASKEEATEAKKNTENFLKRIGLSLSDSPEKTKKVDIRLANFHFLGLNFSKEKICWKKNKEQTKEWIHNVLNVNNMEYYKDCATFDKKIEKMNFKIQGLGEYLKYYHTRENIDEINKRIRHRKRNGSYKKIQLLDTSEVNPIIPLQKWQSLFN